VSEIDLTSQRPDPRWEEAMQRACEQRLEDCMVAYWHKEEEGCDGTCPDEPANPACAPFDGCDTCVVREILDAAWPFLSDAARKGLLDE